MTEEVETQEQPGSSSQPGSDATPGSSAPNNPTDGAGPTGERKAESSNAAGDKKPKSMSEAMAQVKLEEPTAETAAGEAPTTKKPESEKPDHDGAGKKDEQPGKPGEGDANGNDPFHKRPEWAELNKALGDESAKKARPILRQLMEREHRATEQVRQLRPVIDELKQLTVDETGFKSMQNIVRAYANDPGAAVPILEKMLQDAKGRSGHIVTSDDLKKQIQAIDKKVEDGLLDEETAEAARTAIREAEKGRASSKQAREKVQQGEEQRQREAREQRDLQTMQSLNSWESNIRERDPDFGNVTPVNDPRHGESVADRVFDAIQLKFVNNPNVNADELIAEATRVHRLARGQLARPAAREQRAVTSTGSSATAKPRPKTLREAMDNVRLE